MKLAEQWVVDANIFDDQDLEAFTRRVQADTLRHCAALMGTPGSISQIWLKKHFESQADKLEA